MKGEQTNCHLGMNITKQNILYILHYILHYKLHYILHYKLHYILIRQTPLHTTLSQRTDPLPHFTAPSSPGPTCWQSWQNWTGTRAKPWIQYLSSRTRSSKNTTSSQAQWLWSIRASSPSTREARNNGCTSETASQPTSWTRSTQLIICNSKIGKLRPGNRQISLNPLNTSPTLQSSYNVTKNTHTHIYIHDREILVGLYQVVLIVMYGRFSRKYLHYIKRFFRLKFIIIFFLKI